MYRYIYFCFFCLLWLIIWYLSICNLFLIIKNMLNLLQLWVIFTRFAKWCILNSLCEIERYRLSFSLITLKRFVLTTTTTTLFFLNYEAEDLQLDALSDANSTVNQLGHWTVHVFLDGFYDSVTFYIMGRVHLTEIFIHSKHFISIYLSIYLSISLCLYATKI